MSHTEPTSPSSRRRFLRQAAFAGVAAAGLISAAPARADSALAVPREDRLPTDGPWVRVKTNRVRQLIRQARRMSHTDPRHPAVEEFLATPLAAQLETAHGPLMTVHFEVYDFLHRMG